MNIAPKEILQHLLPTPTSGNRQTYGFQIQQDE
jgi:hypothetical protein